MFQKWKDGLSERVDLHIRDHPAPQCQHGNAALPLPGLHLSSRAEKARETRVPSAAGMHLSAVAWAGAFLLFLFAYGPILFAPRAGEKR